MTQTHEPLIEECIELAAPPPRVWALVSDLTRMSEWSPAVDSTRLRAGAEEVALGVEFTSRNTHGELSWITKGTVTRFEVEREIAFRVEESLAVWSFALSSTPDGGTLVTQRRETPEGLSEESLELTDGFMGGQEAFTETLREGMRETLEAIKAAAE